MTQIWRDDMMLGATELSLALSAARSPARLPGGLAVRSAGVYLSDAARWASQWLHGRNATSDTLNLYNVSAQADYELSLAIGRHRAARLAVKGYYSVPGYAAPRECYFGLNTGTGLITSLSAEIAARNEPAATWPARAVFSSQRARAIYNAAWRACEEHAPGARHEKALAIRVLSSYSGAMHS